MDEESNVLVKKGRNASVYHKDSGGSPPCTVDSDNPDEWSEWTVEKAKVWKSACQNPRCFGDDHAAKSAKEGDTWPV